MDNYSKIRVVGRGKNELLFSSELPYSEICKIVEQTTVKLMLNGVFAKNKMCYMIPI